MLRILKVIAVVLMVIVSTAGGALVRLMEVWNDPAKLPVPKNRMVNDGLSSDKKDQTLAVNVDIKRNPELQGNVRNTVNVLIVGLDDVEGGSRTDAIALAVFDGGNSALRIASIATHVYISRKKVGIK